MSKPDNKSRNAPAPRTGARDPLLAALIGKLPSGGTFAREDREAWLNLMAAAFDVAYGRNASRVVIGPAGGGMADASTALLKASLSRRSAGDDVIDLPKEFRLRTAARWYVEEDGTAKMPDGADAWFEAVPVGTVLLDYRTPGESMQLATISWADGTWPASHVSQRELRLEQAKREAA